MESNNSKIPLEIKEKWIDALRSGEYSQTSRSLRDKNGYCCLGVLARVCGYSENELRGKEFLYSKNFPNVPEILQGLYSKTYVFELSNMNDTGYSFTEIADWIEQNL